VKKPRKRPGPRDAPGPSRTPPGPVKRVSRPARQFPPPGAGEAPRGTKEPDGGPGRRPPSARPRSGLEAVESGPDMVLRRMTERCAPPLGPHPRPPPRRLGWEGAGPRVTAPAPPSGAASACRLLRPRVCPDLPYASAPSGPPARVSLCDGFCVAPLDPASVGLGSALSTPHAAGPRASRLARPAPSPPGHQDGRARAGRPEAHPPDLLEPGARWRATA
jgi:hypothetical protein